MTSQAKSQPTKLQTMVGGAVLLLIVAGGMLVALMSQVSTPDYHALFRFLAPLAAVHLVVVGLYFLRVKSWHRWLALGFGALAGAGFVNLALRVL